MCLHINQKRSSKKRIFLLQPNPQNCIENILIESRMHALEPTFSSKSNNCRVIKILTMSFANPLQTHDVPQGYHNTSLMISLVRLYLYKLFKFCKLIIWPLIPLKSSRWWDDQMVIHDALAS